MIMGIHELGEGKTDERGGREIVSFRAKKALVGAGARILFYPTLVYNVLRNKMQADFRWWDEIDQFLLLGAVPFPNDVPRLQQLGVRGVVTLNEPYETLVPSNVYKVHGIDHLVIPTRDYLYAPTPVDICRAVDFIHINASHGKITYVHCKAGRGRSATIVLCYLVKYKNMTPMAALEYVRSRRPRVLLAPSQWQAVEAYNKNKLKFPAIQSPKSKHPHPQDTETSDKISLCSGAKTRTTSPLEEECFITEEDLEGYESFPEAYDDNDTASTSEEEEVLITDKDLQGYETFVDALDENSSTCPIEDEVLITEVDLEGYETFLDACDENSISSNHINQTFPKARKLSCFCSSFRWFDGNLPVSSRHPPIRLASS
ncbi:phosphatidylglycerophosphate phosphatase PTPMT2-like isoform X1 [Zingiber officinale]|uniref:phosphatidylglycerophosphate phosphatase PTPMT2-like isoform X1 n=1 Tax=Zingiber officinale TaxID=94328 RepID=UPI001C4C036F|nr:phosphatidylglycerophosphate phosphatase PTPMT2-like isoform X1 [Zingiber officinale]